MTGRLQIAENLLKDAVSNKLSPMSREDCAFNAGYLFALEAIPSSFTGKLEHPSHLVITVAARNLGLDMSAMEPALNFIQMQYSPGRDGRNTEALMAWALVMKVAVKKMSNDYEHGQIDSTLPNERILRTFAKLSDSRNAYLFTAEAARKAFAHIRLDDPEAAQAPRVRQSLNAAEQLLRQHDERAANIVIGGSVLVMLIAFVAAVLAIIFMR